MLFKNVLRTLKQQYIQLILLGMIIILSSFIYTTMDYGVGGILNPTETYFEESNQEDFAISMMDLLLEDDYQTITDQCSLSVSPDIRSLSGLHNVSKDCYDLVIENRIETIQAYMPTVDLELREYKDIYYDFNDDSHRIRILKDSKRINTSYIVEGNKPTEDNEIAIAEAYADSNELVVGDSITIKDKTYQISGFVLFADYSLALFGQQLIFDNESQTLGLLTDSEFERITSTLGFDIMGDLKNVEKDTFEEEVIETYRNEEELRFVTNIVLTKNNRRRGAIYGEIEGGQAMGLGLSLIIASIALLIVGIMVSKVLQKQRGPIGILKSMGYSRFEITIPYIFFIAILAFPAILIGYVLGIFAAEPMKNMYLMFYLLPHKPIETQLTTFIIAVLVPFIFLLSISFFIIRKMLTKKPVTLLNPQVSKSANKVTKIMTKLFKKLKIVSKLRQLLLFRNFVKFIVFLIGMFYAAFLIYFSMAMFGMFDRMITDYYDQTNHTHIGYCEQTQACIEPTGNQEKVIELPSVILEDDEISLVGINPDSKLHPLFNKSGDEITSDVEDGLVITESLHLKKGYKVGDILTIDIGTETAEIEVVSITKEYTGDKAYIAREYIAVVLSGNEDYHNVIYSDQELDESDFALVVSTQKILDQTQKMQQFTDVMIYIMMTVSIIIGIIIVYILTVMTIEDNFYNISLFKVIGYNNKEIDKMILGGYLFYGVGIFVLAIPISYFAFQFMTLFFAREYNVLMPFEFNIFHGLFGVTIFLILFYAGAFVAKKKLDKISLQEALKMYEV